jgi:hypothetical protein
MKTYAQQLADMHMKIQKIRKATVGLGFVSCFTPERPLADFLIDAEYSCMKASEELKRLKRQQKQNAKVNPD